MRALSERQIGLGSTALGIAAMVVDHLLPGDWPAFLIAAALTSGLAALLFLSVVPRTLAAPEPAHAAATRGFAIAILAVLTGLPLVWLGLPFPIAGAAVALGLRGLEGDRRGLAMAAVALGTLVLAVDTGLYVYEAITDPG